MHTYSHRCTCWNCSGKCHPKEPHLYIQSISFMSHLTGHLVDSFPSFTNSIQGFLFSCFVPYLSLAIFAQPLFVGPSCFVHPLTNVVFEASSFFCLCIIFLLLSSWLLLPTSCFNYHSFNYHLCIGGAQILISIPELFLAVHSHVSHWLLDSSIRISHMHHRCEITAILTHVSQSSWYTPNLRRIDCCHLCLLYYLVYSLRIFIILFLCPLLDYRFLKEKFVSYIRVPSAWHRVSAQ